MAYKRRRRQKIFDFLDYMLRPEAFEPSKHADEMEYVYSEFIPNEKSQAQDIKKNDPMERLQALKII